MKHTLITIITATLSLAASTAASAQKLVIKGSDTLGAKLVPMLAEEYKTRNKGATFEIAAEGSSTGIAAIIGNTAQIGMSSRRAKATEISAGSAKGVKLRPIVVAYDGIGIIINGGNPVATLTRRQIELIFTGEYTDWSSVGGKAGRISIYTRNTSSGTYADFKELAMRKRDYASSSQKMAGNEQIASEIARNPNGIGYVGLAYLQSVGIKVVAIDGVLPSQESVQGKKYPYARPTFYYTDGEPSGETAKFIDFTLSDEGQAIAKKVGFVPVRPISQK
ncbi:MAG: phosphate ABC transporter substrate-binding protein [Puniceicoccales bacterium]|jgi:phosphate transport system substrate-binding protein|nr:phosphate ABC transporter substrate-binding protein [Puniceicoccales bacterium]